MAGRYAAPFVDTVRAASDIVRVVGDYVALKPAGKRLKGLCPFHTEKTPSFTVDPSAQLFYCFGCQTGGDSFKFVQLYEKVGFGESIELLARRFGVPLPARESRAGAEDDKRDRLVALNAEAETFFRNALRDRRAGARGRAYLVDRGLHDETVERLGIGYAPEGWDALRDHLLARRFTARELLEGGLAVEAKSGDRIYDRFRDRLMFPIRDAQGRAVAFGGRTLGNDPAKYVNSPETAAYVKGNHLYGLDSAREPIRREGFAIVVEGYLDLAAVVQAGFENVVATLGTAFTPAQARLLARFTQRITVSYDGDAAGATATARSLDLMLAQGFDVRVVELPPGQDPDDCIRSEGAAAYGKLLHLAPEYVQFLINAEVRKRDLARPEQKVEAANALLPHLARIENAIERSEWAGRLADALGIDAGPLRHELRKAIRKAQTSVRAEATTVPPLREAEARLVARLLASPDERREWAARIGPAELADTSVRPIVETIVRLDAGGAAIDYPLVLESLDADGDRELLTRIAFRDEPDEGPGIEDCLAALERQRLQRAGRSAVREIENLVEAGASQDLERRLLELQEVARRRDRLS